MVFKNLVNYGKIFVLMILMVLGLTQGAIALPVPAQQPLQEIQVHLGNAKGELKFEPDHLEFTAGQRYKLLLDNPSNQKHYFTAKDFADTIWSQKVEAGKVEIKGAIHELELKPGAIAEWVFIPQKTGEFELHCSVPGHAAAGMVGTINVLANPLP
ncbi:blue-copper-protein-like protein [[Synechococcus] sp. NIES-970]|uniref:cupredoxin domain-containing protein n=1 Tax=Picosynechococcus sp. NKBG15041c TaxID=1407650 RepID=UPI000465A757|nr:cupredoxin domain-containing protein [Picosynechococcus sp. NKBG15041c]BAW96555.1 blue-copper-protein-like protein [[Synechococcus] sp. NIES-970]